mgnify:FL=1
MAYSKVEGHDGLVRNESGVVLNINKEEISSARARKERWLEEQKEKEQLKKTVERLENDMTDIKSLLSKIAEKI